MRKIGYAILLLVLTFSRSAAQSECDGRRYIMEIFQNYDLSSDITYGQNYNTALSTNETLKMDIYQPQGDTLPLRPLIVMAHGGSFLYGDKALSDILPLAQAFSRKGYVCASINYRLWIAGVPLPGPDSTKATEEVMRAVQDAKAAVRFFYKDRMTTNTYRIDTSRIYFLGCSAGGFVALHYAYLDKWSEMPSSVDTTQQGMSGGISGNSGNPGYPENIKAIVSLAGAIGDTNWMEPGGLPVLSMHGTADGTVPYGSATIVLSGQWPLLEVDGSASVHLRAAHLGYENCLYTHYGAGHVEYVSDANYLDTTLAVVTWWLSGITCGTTPACGYTPVPVGNAAEMTPAAIRLWPNPAGTFLNVEIPAGMNTVEASLNDLSGRTLHSFGSPGPGIHRWDLPELPPGVYLLRLGADHQGRVFRILKY